MSEVTLGDNGATLVKALAQSAEALQKSFDLGHLGMEKYNTTMKKAKKLTVGELERVTPLEMENTIHWIYRMCDKLDDPKEIMQHVRTAREMIHVWSDVI